MLIVNVINEKDKAVIAKCSSNLKMAVFGCIFTHFEVDGWALKSSPSIRETYSRYFEKT